MDDKVTRPVLVWAVVTAIFLVITFITGTVLPYLPEF